MSYGIKRTIRGGLTMPYMTFNGKTYEVDTLGFLLDFNHWDEDFAAGMAPSVFIRTGLTKKHWDIIYFIRDTMEQLGRCPLVYHTFRMSGLPLKEIKELFPTGYLRGACKLAGITYKEAYVGRPGIPGAKLDSPKDVKGKTYEVDDAGYLVDSNSWDPHFAAFKAQELNAAVPLSDKHWDIIYFLRRHFSDHGQIPTVFETCESMGIDLEELEKMFPSGYHRGAVKIAGLRFR